MSQINGEKEYRKENMPSAPGYEWYLHAKKLHRNHNGPDEAEVSSIALPVNIHQGSEPVFCSWYYQGLQET